MRNIVFFEALAATVDLPDERERETLQKELTAAIIVLRLFADWVDSPAVMIGTPGTLANIKAAVADVPANGVRQLLETVVAAVAKGFGDPSAVAAPLLAYAWILEEQGNPLLAEDVLLTVANTLEPLNNPADYLFLASIHRRLGEYALGRRHFDGAEFYFRRQLTLARTAGDEAVALDARVHLADVQLPRGNLGVAESMLTEVIADARDAGEQRVEVYARRVRGGVMMRQGRAADALREYYMAYQQTADWREREWLLGDIAGCASMLGLRRLARIIFTSLSKTAHNAMSRSLALVNLLEVTVLDRDREAYESVLEQLRAYDLPREQSVYVLLWIAAAAELWQGADAGLAAYRTAEVAATRAGVHDIAFHAAEHVRRLEQGLASNQPIRVGSDAPPTANEEDWAEMTEALEADCRLRLQSASASE